MKRGFLIDLDEIPETKDDICNAVISYCKKNNLQFILDSNHNPITVKIDDVLYSVKKECQYKYQYVNCWVLHCQEI